MNYDVALIASVLETKRYVEAVRLGAGPHLLSGNAAILWDLLSAHYDRFGEVPSLEHFQNLAPTYQHGVPKDSLEVIIHELKTIKLGNEIDRGNVVVAEANATDPWEAKRLFVELADKINLSNQDGEPDLIVGEGIEKILAQLRLAREGNGLIGYPWPWEYMNQNTMGVVGGNVFYFYGRDKSKKTFLLLFLAIFFALELKLKVLFFTRDDTKEELELRAACLLCGFDYLEFLKGNISTEGAAMLKEAMQYLAASRKFIITDTADGFTGYKSKVEEVQPAIVMHDFPKAMADDEMGNKFNVQDKYVGALYDRLAGFHKKTRIPGFFAGHANRTGAKTSGKDTTELAWSDHIVRRMDGAFRVISQDNRTAIIASAGRNFKKHMAFTIDGTLCNGFGRQIDTKADWVESAEAAEAAEEKSKEAANSIAPKGEKTKFRAQDFKRVKRGAK